MVEGVQPAMLRDARPALEEDAHSAPVEKAQAVRAREIQAAPAAETQSVHMEEVTSAPVENMASSSAEVVVKEEIEEDSGIEVDRASVRSVERNTLDEAPLAPACAIFDNLHSGNSQNDHISAHHRPPPPSRPPPCDRHVEDIRKHSFDECPDFGSAGRFFDPRVLTDTIRISNLVPQVSARLIRRQFKDFGRIKCLVVKHNGPATESWCWIAFDSTSAAKKALDRKHGKKLSAFPMAIEYDVINWEGDQPRGTCFAATLSGDYDWEGTSTKFTYASRDDHPDEQVESSSRSQHLASNQIRRPGDPGFVPCDFPHNCSRNRIYHERHQCKENPFWEDALREHNRIVKRIREQDSGGRSAKRRRV